MTREGFPEFSPLISPKVMSEETVGPFVRQIAMNSDRLSQVVRNRHFVSNFTERLRQIKRISEKFAELTKTDTDTKKEEKEKDKDKDKDKDKEKEKEKDKEKEKEKEKKSLIPG